MGVDNVLEVDIVTPDGQLQTISECSNPDLFWAVRHYLLLPYPRSQLIPFVIPFLTHRSLRSEAEAEGRSARSLQ